MCYKWEVCKEKFHKSIAKFVFPALLILALFVPVLLAVPVSAASVDYYEAELDSSFASTYASSESYHLYKYNGVILPALPPAASVNAYNLICTGTVYVDGDTSNPLSGYLLITSPNEIFYYPADDVFLVTGPVSFPVFFTVSNSISWVSTSFTADSSGYSAILGLDTFVWSNYDVYSVSGELCHSASAPVFYRSVPESPVVSSNISSSGETFTYELNAAANQLTCFATVGFGSLSYVWYRSDFNGNNVAVVGTGSYFTPPTGTNSAYRYWCEVTNTDMNLSSVVSTGVASVIVGDPELSGIVDNSDKLDSISQQIDEGFDSMREDISDASDKVVDALNPTNPELDQSVSDLESDIDILDSFESDHIASLEENKHTIIGAFDIFGPGSTLLSSFNFVTLIVNGVAGSLGDYLIVFTLPLALGLFLFICSRVRGVDKPRKYNSDARQAGSQMKTRGSGGHEPKSPEV